MAIDRGDWHHDDAGTWEKACRHIGLFLWWAFERGLGSSEESGIDVVELARSPTQVFIAACDTKLWDSDLTDEGQRFAAAEYQAYLGAVSARARELGVDDYEIPESEETRRHFFDWLDARLAAWRKE